MQTYYACDGKLFILNHPRSRFDLFKDQPADIRMPTSPVHNSGLNMVALGYNSAFFIANIYVSNMKVNDDSNVYLPPPHLKISTEIQDVVILGNQFK